MRFPWHRERRIHVPGELSEHEVNELAEYNSRVRRGIVHTGEYAARMRALQERFNRAQDDRLRAEGWVLTENGCAWIRVPS